jgi:hypothetical protein
MNLRIRWALIITLFLFVATVGVAFAQDDEPVVPSCEGTDVCVRHRCGGR